MPGGHQPDARAPTFLGKYQLLARLGAGGMAEVLLARLDGPAGFSKHVAIKRMRPELTAHREFIDLFLEEARTASLLSHTNICQVNELSAAQGDYFMVLEYLEGVALSSALVKALASPGSLPVPFLVGIAQQACEGLHHAHEMADPHGRPYDIIHRDISPPNLFVTTGGVVKVLDFGISKSRDSVVKTLTGQIRGKFAYMSPEQLRGEKLDRRSDVFSLAIVLFELLTGRRLFRRKSRLEVFRAIVKEPIPSAAALRPDLPPTLVEVLGQALARDREARMPSARAFGEALGDSIRELGGPMNAKAIGALVREQFRAELESRRQLLLSPPGVELSSPASGVGATGGPLATQPTARLRAPDNTVPDARCAEIAGELADTSAMTSVWSRAEVTSVDLGLGEEEILESALAPAPEASGAGASSSVGGAGQGGGGGSEGGGGEGGGDRGGG